MMLKLRFCLSLCELLLPQGITRLTSTWKYLSVSVRIVWKSKVDQHTDCYMLRGFTAKFFRTDYRVFTFES